MWRLILLFAVATLCIHCAQDPNDHDTPKEIMISGHINDAENSAVRVSGMVEMRRDSTDEDGNFELRFRHHMPEYFTLRLPGKSLTLFLYPGDSIYVTADKEDFDASLTFEGDRVAEALYLHEKSGIEASYGLGNLREFYTLAPADYLARIDSLQSDLAMLLSTYNGGSEADTFFTRLESAYPEYRFTELNAQYSGAHRWLADVAEGDSIDFPAEYWKERLRSLSYDDAELLKLPAFRTVVRTRVHNGISELMDRDSVYNEMEHGWMYAAMIVAEESLSGSEIREYFKFHEIHEMISYVGPGLIDTFYNRFLAESTNAFYRDHLEKALNRWEPIMPGKEVPDFAFTDIDSNIVRLSDLQGKLIYIDVWATWCGPCIAEHPHWEKLYGEYEDQEIAFLTVSIDNTRAPWEKMVREKQMQGLHWYADGAWQSELAKHFLIQGIPRFILIDRESKVITPSAARPSGSIRKDLDEHLRSI